MLIREERRKTALEHLTEGLDGVSHLLRVFLPSALPRAFLPAFLPAFYPWRGELLRCFLRELFPPREASDIDL